MSFIESDAFFFLFFISRCLLATENEFETCMEHFFPELINKKPLEFTRQQWNLIRRRFGKPRRFSFLLNKKKLKYFSSIDYHQHILKMKELNYLNNAIFFELFKMKQKHIINLKESFLIIFHLRLFHHYQLVLVLSVCLFVF
jgi:hypothetical protein